MPYLEDLIAARDNIAAQLASLTTDPKPSYDIDGQRVGWNDHFRALSRELERLNQMIQAAEPFELDTWGNTP